MITALKVCSVGPNKEDEDFQILVGTAEGTKIVSLSPELARSLYVSLGFDLQVYEVNA